MDSLREYIDDRLEHGWAFFSKADALASVQQSSKAFESATVRLLRKGRLIAPKRGFYLIARPEDRALGGPEPSKWIDPLMRHLGVDYRVTLLRAAAYHGSAHQAAMVFQVIAPKQIPGIEIGRHRVQFLYQSPDAFLATNRPEWLARLKSEAGYAQVAGVELTLLDMCRYFHQAGGIDAAAQVVHDIGGKARPKILAAATRSYENSVARRLGYLLDRFGHARQASALLPLVRKAKSLKPLDPGVKPVADLEVATEQDRRWKLIINTSVEIDE